VADRPRLRFGILGAARIAHNQFLPGVLASHRATVAAIASRDRERAAAVAADFNIPRVHTSYQELLEDPNVDAVYVPLPNSLHEEWTVAAARAGKHVLCEKPLSSHASGAQRMADACHSVGVVLMEAFMWRHHPQHHRVREILRSGAIGDPNFVRSSFTFLVSPPNVRLRHDLEGGSLMDVGCYGVNAARWLFESEPDRAIGVESLDPVHNVDIAFAGVLHFSDNRLAAFESSFARPTRNTYTVEGPKGSLHIERAFRPDADPARIVLQRPGMSDVIEEIPPANQFGLEVDHFVDSVEAGHLLPPAEDGVAQAKVIEALYASARAN
jgi:xylose dehydrogenase (NAD/NADP)